ncbi:MAG: prolipoprotein diacylglyceryl transferase family protein [Oscillochloridaceae bacterium umkhey_bin13]
MYPLLELGPLRLSSGGLALLIAINIWLWQFERTARKRGGDALNAHASACGLPALLGAGIGARLWYGVHSLDLYAATPSLFWALRIADLAWPGALLGGALAGWLWARRRKADPLALADAAALALPAPLALASLGALLSGEIFGAPTNLAWGIPLHGAMRHPTQLLYVGAALVAWVIMARSQNAPAGVPLMRLLLINGLAMLLIEPLRADALLLPGGWRSGQVVGLIMALGALWGLQRRT